jgi:hypothetical protein
VPWADAYPGLERAVKVVGVAVLITGAVGATRAIATRFAASTAGVGAHAGAAAVGVPFRQIGGTRGLAHSFDSHASQWFGRQVSASTHLAQWQGLVERAAASRLQVSWSVGNNATVGHLARIEGKYLFTQFYVGGPRAGELATAFVPTQNQLSAILKALGR